MLRGKLWSTPWAAVVFCINHTDIAECLIRGGMQRFKANGTVEFTNPPRWEPLYAASHLVRFIVINVCRYSWMLLSEAETKQKERQAVQQIAATLHHAHAALQARHIPLLVVLQPMHYDLINEAFINSEMDTLASALANVPLLNLLPYYRDSLHYTEQNYKDIYWPADGHFNPTGYGLMAQKISRQLLPLCCTHSATAIAHRPHK
ncbi:MAG: SGNH/GDSL hydrolase family protein [Bacteroidetes bacterium]|nr:SGNH/GDSL hydrolase family protein [Bacteroidota bacterium]